MKVKTSELIGKALDYAVAICKGKGIDLEDVNDPWITVDGIADIPLHAYNPSQDWAIAGPIIEREWLDVTPWPNESREEMRWHCQQHDSGGDCAQYGSTPLTAAMRCYVASKLGDEVEIPDALRCTVGGPLYP